MKILVVCHIVEIGIDNTANTSVGYKKHGLVTVFFLYLIKKAVHPAGKLHHGLATRIFIGEMALVTKKSLAESVHSLEDSVILLT